mgnify:CR=1 FL=1
MVTRSWRFVPRTCGREQAALKAKTRWDCGCQHARNGRSAPLHSPTCIHNMSSCSLSSVKHTAKYTFIDTFIVFTLHSRMHGVKGV